MRINRKYQGVVLIILSAFFFGLMNVCVRLSGDLPSIQKSFFSQFYCIFDRNSHGVASEDMVFREKGKSVLPFYALHLWYDWNFM